MYDEFGNLKKKYRAKTQQAEAARGLPGSGRAGWEVEELGMAAYLELFILHDHLRTFPTCSITLVHFGIELHVILES